MSIYRRPPQQGSHQLSTLPLKHACGRNRNHFPRVQLPNQRGDSFVVLLQAGKVSHELLTREGGKHPAKQDLRSPSGQLGYERGYAVTSASHLQSSSTR